MTRFIRKNWALLLSVTLLCVILLVTATDVWAQEAPNKFTETMFDVAGKLFGWFADSILRPIFGLCRAIFIATFNFTIIQFGEHWSGSGGLSGLGDIWAIFRDLVNIIIVILFIVSSILTILSESAFGVNRTKTLIALLGAAVFVNFSGFIAFFLIDLSHVLLIVFGNQIFDANTFANMDLFGEEIDMSVGLSSLSVTNAFSLIYSFSKMIVYTFLSFGFLAFSILLIERFFFAIILILTSPLAFLGFFVKKSGLASVSPGSFIVRGYDMWVQRFSHIALLPLIIVFGLAIIIYIYESVYQTVMDTNGLKKTLADNINFPSSSSGPGIVKMLVGTTIANGFLIYGVFKVYAMAKNTYVWKSGRVGKSAARKAFNFTKGVARSFAGPGGKLGGKLESGFDRLSSLRSPAGSGRFRNFVVKTANKVGSGGGATVRGTRAATGWTTKAAKTSARVAETGRDAFKEAAKGNDVQEIFKKHREKDLEEARKSVSALRTKIDEILRQTTYFGITPGTIPAGIGRPYEGQKWDDALKAVRGHLNDVRRFNDVDSIRAHLERNTDLAKTIYDNEVRTSSPHNFTEEFDNLENIEF